MKHGFDVLSREKFEAKLRKARGTMRGEGLSELTDISEVIQAAEDGALKSDYLLQINEFALNSISDYDINLGAYPAFQRLIVEYPEAVSQLRKIQYLRCSEYTAILNAKLIHVPTGQIVWIGEHTASTRGLFNNAMSLRIDVKEQVLNQEDVANFVAAQNTEAARKSRSADEAVHYPDWVVDVHVSGPVVTKGYCRIEDSAVSVDSVRIQLSKLVARTLMRSIQVGGGRESGPAQ